MITVPHPDVYWVHCFLEVCVFKMYYSCMEEGESLQISSNISIFDAFGKEYLCDSKRFLFLKYSLTIYLDFT